MLRFTVTLVFLESSFRRSTRLGCPPRQSPLFCLAPDSASHTGVSGPTRLNRGGRRSPDGPATSRSTCPRLSRGVGKRLEVSRGEWSETRCGLRPSLSDVSLWSGVEGVRVSSRIRRVPRSILVPSPPHQCRGLE